MAKKDKVVKTSCKSCGSSDVSPVEARSAHEEGKQRMKCDKCGFEFLVENSGRKTRKLLG